eukprot:1823079-Rhodomonas_salina.1
MEEQTHALQGGKGGSDLEGGAAVLPKSVCVVLGTPAQVPAPSTRNPNSSTLNPEPETLNPEP